MSTTATKIIEQAKAWLGKKESNGTHKAIVDIYNEHKPLAQGYKVKYTDNWCGTFVSACAIKCGATDIIPTECGCQRMIDLFRKKGIWIENENRTPKKGDIIFYDWDDSGKGDNKGWSDHVGIVEKVSNGIITVIEGNKNNSVSRREIKVNAKFIRGYGVPKYQEETKPTPTKTLEQVAKDVINGKYGNGSDRKKALEKDGYDFDEVQDKVNELLNKKPSKPSTSYYKKYTGKSNKIDEVFKSIGVQSAYIGTYSKRKPIASKNGISNYTGTSSQNLKLIDYAKKGKLKKA